ncbi:CDP-alcohol phosphatidyltransferase family protein [Candidatus Paracaedibacter symbiosus]|uniref:CDP-alcohol phosphatidyltransferase family protein n=1 Tax=Candidatus Paracaedibacter symbiosus TaxID=244582 RepID=UPI000A027CA0|nr:phosphatidylcholine/phosphatidylserine synthase [Candidatus Paracaedibacter symbiosus]
MRRNSNNLRDRLTSHLPSNLKRISNKPLNFASMLPNMTTVLALCTGLSSVRFALMGQWEFAIIAIFASAIMDTMDGRLARYLGSTSRFGAELDSLSDFICFGVSPTLIVYLRSLHEWNGLGWIITLYFSVCMALRLARFNTVSIEGDSDNWPETYFMGIPAPPGAIIVLMPLMIDIVLKNMSITSPVTSPYVMTIMLLLVGTLCISKVPTFSHKTIKIAPKYVPYVLICVALLGGALFVEPWVTLSVISIAYLFTIPFSITKFRKEHRGSAT